MFGLDESENSNQDIDKSSESMEEDEKENYKKMEFSISMIKLSEVKKS